MKTYVIEIDHRRVRTIFADKRPKVGEFIPETIWLGVKLAGGIITKIF